MYGDNLEEKAFPYSDITVKIVKRSDIIKCIEKNIKDVDVAFELIDHLEVKADGFLKDGYWTGYPYLGSVRVPDGLSKKVRAKFNADRRAAKEYLSHSDYLLFTKQCALDNFYKIQYERFYKRIVSMAKKEAPTEFGILSSHKGVEYARFKFAMEYCIKPVKTEYEEYYNLTNGEESDDRHDDND